MAELPGGLKRELRRAVIALARQNVLDARPKRQERALYVQMYGSEFGQEVPGDVCMAEQMLQGLGVWSGLYDELMLVSTGKDTTSAPNKRLVVKSILWPASEGKQFIVGHGGLTFDDIFMKAKPVSKPEKYENPRYWSGATLQGEAMILVNTVRVASDYAVKYLRNGEYPPGTNFEDYLLHVRKMCYVHFVGGLHEDRVELRREKFGAPLNPSGMPSSYYFFGMVAFCLFGPKPLSGQYLTMFDPSIDMTEGLVATSAVKRDVVRARKIAAGVPVPPAKRFGPTTKELLAAAQLEQNRIMNGQKTIIDLLQASNAEVQSMVDQKKALAQQMQAYAQVGLKDRCKTLADKLDALDEEISAHRKRCRQWQDDLDNERQNAPKKAYLLCMKSIGCEDDVVVIDDTKEHGDDNDSIKDLLSTM